MGGVIYMVTTVLICCLYYFTKRFDISLDIYQYSNPFVIISSCGLLLWAANLKIKNFTIINYISGSAFAVYLFHQYPFDNRFFEAYSMVIYETFSGIWYLCVMLVYLIAVFLFAIILDQPRKWIWDMMHKGFYNIYQKN